MKSFDLLYKRMNQKDQTVNQSDERLNRWRVEVRVRQRRLSIHQFLLVVLLYLSLIHWNPTEDPAFTFCSPFEATTFVFPSPSPTFFPYLAAAPPTPPPSLFFRPLSGTGFESLAHWSAHEFSIVTPSRNKIYKRGDIDLDEFYHVIG